MNMLRDLLQPTRRNLLRGMFTATSALTRFAVNGVEAALALDFIGSEYRTGNTSTTFADAFMGNSPKLTYDPGSASSSQSTMVNSAGHLVWAPHNLVTYSEDFSQWDNPIGITVDSSTTTDPLGGSTAYTYSGFSGVVNNRLTGAFSLAVGVPCTFAIWLKGAAGETISIELDSFAAPENTITLTGDWQLETISNSNPDTGRVRIISRAGNTADVVSIWGAHVYRSDLGGMAPVPGAVGDFQYYVPTNGNAEYLPRVGHHVHNGSAWVNEGLLIESEERTNLVAYSDFSSGWTEVRASLNTTTQAGPDGVASSSVKLVASTDNDSHFTTPGAVASGNYAVSVFAKAAEYSWLKLTVNDVGFPGSYFDLSGNGAIGAVGTGLTPHIESVGNGWFRCSVVNDTPITRAYVEVTTGDATSTFTGDGTSGIYLYGAQLEAGATPSSYIPTSGSTVIRGGQSLVVPANWYDVDNPTPTGPELVTDFSTYASNADFFADGFVRSDAVNATFDAVNDTLDMTDAVNVRLDGHVSFVEGVTYEVSITNDGPDSFSFQDNFTNFNRGLLVGTNTFVFTKGSGVNVRVVVGAGKTASISNISVRQVSAPQFGWPETEYIGPELIVDGSGNWAGDFDVAADASAWTLNSGGTSSFTVSGGEAYLNRGDPAQSGSASIYKVLTTTPGKTYLLSLEKTAHVCEVDVGTGFADGSYYNGSLDGNDILTTFTAQGSTTYITIRNNQIAVAQFDNISVREINPLSVSMQMDGRMTYADDVTDGELVRPYRWHIDNNNRIRSRLSVVSGSDTGNWIFQQTNAAANDEVATGSNTYSPGTFVPFNISSRHGSTFVNGAVDGVALTADTTPTALPDLSSKNLEIAQDFMGTIGTFRQFAGDIGDAGLVTATNPSTEPTLSLTFDGTGGSFYNLSWSE